MARVASKALRKLSKTLQWAVISITAISAIGCGSDVSASSDANRKQFEKRVGADETKAKAFVDTLASMSFPQREPYAKEHPTEVRNMALIPDPTLQTKFRNLMTNRG